MAKKGKKVEKETRRLIESVSDLVKKKDGGYKFKTKNKKIRKRVRKTCTHWVIRKGGKELPAVIQDPNNPNNWKCGICGASFPIKPPENSNYSAMTHEMLEYINQLQFWSVKLGGDKEDTKMFIRLRSDLPRLEKVAKQIVKQVNKRETWEKNRERSDAMTQFDMYSGFNYRP